MTAEQVARQHQAGRNKLSDALGRLIRRMWSGINPADLDGEWARAVPSLALGLAGAQLAAARQADDYVTEALGEHGLDAASDDGLDPGAFAGVASDGRSLDGLLRNPITVVKAGLAGGATVDQAMAAGFANLDMLVRTQLADAGRAADQVAMVARPAVTGYVRMVRAGACSRCIILAGRFYRWNAGFDRHPRCSCTHVPSTENADEVRTNPRAYFDSLSRAEQDKVFTKAGAEAIRDGADMNRVVNARRGMYQAGDLSLTTEATTRRGINRKVRLMPEQIYKIAGDDRDEALRLLRTNGYLIGKPAAAPRPARPIEIKPPAPVPVVKAVPKPVAAPQLPAAAVVKGRDRLADEAARLDADPRGFEMIQNRAMREKWDSELAGIGSRQGFDGLPQVVTRAEMDAAVGSGWTEVWRGVVGSGEVTPAQINGRFRSGAYEPGRGQYGNGWYTSVRRITAEIYRGRDPMTDYPAGGGVDFELSDLDPIDPGPDSLLRIAINPAARVVDYDDLLEMHEAWGRGRPGGSAAGKVFADLGRFAAARGYDVVRVGLDHHDGAYYPGWETSDEDELGGAIQWIVLNRTAVMVQRAEDMP